MQSVTPLQPPGQAPPTSIYALPDRIFDKIHFEPNTGCWLWTAAAARKGYGAVRWDGRMLSAHRVVYSLLVGPIPSGLLLDHRCRMHACVNPDHLRIVNDQINSIENSNSFAARNAAKTHCINGHPFDEANTIHARLGRNCRACAASRLRALRARRRQQAGGQP